MQHRSRQGKLQARGHPAPVTMPTIMVQQQQEEQKRLRPHHGGLVDYDRLNNQMLAIWAATSSSSSTQCRNNSSSAQCYECRHSNTSTNTSDSTPNCKNSTIQTRPTLVRGLLRVPTVIMAGGAMLQTVLPEQRNPNRRHHG